MGLLRRAIDAAHRRAKSFPSVGRRTVLREMPRRLGDFPQWDLVAKVLAPNDS